MADREVHGCCLDGMAIPSEDPMMDRHIFGGTDPDIYGTDRLLRRAAGGTGDPGDSNGTISIRHLQNAGEHFTDALPADGTMLLECHASDTEPLRFDGVGIADHRAVKDSRGAGYGGESCGKLTAGAAFGEGDRLALPFECSDDLSSYLVEGFCCVCASHGVIVPSLSHFWI